MISSTYKLSILWYTTLYSQACNPLAPVLGACLCTAQNGRELPDRFQPLQCLQLLNGRTKALGRQAKPRAILELAMELGPRQRDLGIPPRNVDLLLQSRAVAHPNANMHRSASHLPIALDLIVHIEVGVLHKFLDFWLLHRCVSEGVERDVRMDQRPRHRKRHRELGFEYGRGLAIRQLVIGVSRHADLDAFDSVDIDSLLLFEIDDGVDRRMQGDAARIGLDDNAAQDQLVVASELGKWCHVRRQSSRIDLMETACAIEWVGHRREAQFAPLRRFHRIACGQAGMKWFAHCAEVF